MGVMKVWNGSAWEAVEGAVPQAVSNAAEKADVMAALRFDPAHPMYGATRGTDATDPGAAVKAANTEAINLAAADAASQGGTLVLKGTYWIDDTVTFNCHVDGASGEILINNTAIAPAVQVGPIVTGEVLQSKTIVMPTVRQMGKVGTGWSGTDIGVRFGHLLNCQITATDTRHFSTNVQLYANGTGNVHNNYYLGTLFNGKINMDFWAIGTGWINQNVFLGGRFHIATSEGTNIAGARHLRTGNSTLTYANNTNTFIGPSFEGNGPEYHVEAWGIYNKILNGRWEASAGPKVLWGTDAHSWTIDDGYNAAGITTTGTAPNTRITTRQSVTWFTGNPTSGAIRVGGSTSINNPIYTIYGTGDLWAKDLATDWMWAWGARALEGKTEAASTPAVQLFHNGYLRFGGDAGIMRGAADVVATEPGDAFQTEVLKIGTRWYWTDSAGNLRTHTARPSTSTTTAEGTIVGTQT